MSYETAERRAREMNAQLTATRFLAQPQKELNGDWNVHIALNPQYPLFPQVADIETEDSVC